MTKQRAASIAMTLALLFVSCGDDRLSREEFVARADEICADLNEELSEMGRPRNEREFQRFVARARESTKEAVQELRELEPPEQDQEEIDRWLDLTERAVELLPEVQQAFEDEDLERMQEVSTQIQESANEAQQIAQEYGFDECGRGEIPAAD